MDVDNGKSNCGMNGQNHPLNGMNRGSENGGVETPNPYKFQETNSWIHPKKPNADKPILKRPFLRKGTGIARFYKGNGKLPEFDSETSNIIPTNITGATNHSRLTSAANNIRVGLPHENIVNGQSEAKEVESGMSPHGQTGPDFGLLGQDTHDFRGFGLRSKSDKAGGVNGGVMSSPSSEYFHQRDDDPYLEMDSSFTESESQARDSCTEDEGKGRLPSSAVSSTSSSTLVEDVPSNRRMKEIDEEEDYSLVDEMEGVCLDDDEELKLFEMMEKIAEEPNLRANSAVVTEFVNTRLDLSPIPRQTHQSSRNGSPLLGLAKTRKNSYSLSSVASSTSTVSERKGGSQDAIPTNVLERVLEQVRSDSEKFSRIMSESGGKRSSTELQGALLTARTMELEAEIKKFREENKNILALREEWQARCNELENAQTHHEQLKDRELRLIEEEKARLVRKKERLGKMVAEYEIKSSELDMSASDAEHQFEQLNAKIAQLQKEIRSKNSQFAKAQNKLKEEIAFLQEKNNKLTTEVERLRKRNNIGNVHKSAQTAVPISVGSDTNIRTVDEPIYNMPSSPANASVSPSNPSKTIPNHAKEEFHCQPRQETENKDDEGQERSLPNGDREIVYLNGTTKIISKDSLFTKVTYYNGDVRESLEDGTVRYFYNESNSWHTTYPDGLEVVEFPNGQIERKNPNGMVEIIYNNGCIKHIYPCGKEECVFPDQTVLRTERNGDKVLLLANGQKEYQTKDFRKRIYPDGTVKILYSDGSQETRYPNGRVRMKNSEGKLIHDAIHADALPSQNS